MAFSNQAYKPNSTQINYTKQSTTNYGGNNKAAIARPAGNFVNKTSNLDHKICYFCQKPGTYVHECPNRCKDMTSHIDVVQVAISSNTEQITCRNSDNLVCMSVKVDEHKDIFMDKQSNSQMFSGELKCVITLCGPANESMFVSAYHDTGAALTLLYDNVLPTSYLLPLNVRSTNGIIDEVSVFQANITSRQGMINGSVEIRLVPRKFIMPNGAIYLIGDNYGARPVLWQPVNVVTRAKVKYKPLIYLRRVT